MDVWSLGIYTVKYFSARRCSPLSFGGVVRAPGCYLQGLRFHSGPKISPSTRQVSSTMLVFRREGKRQGFGGVPPTVGAFTEGSHSLAHSILPGIVANRAMHGPAILPTYNAPQEACFFFFFRIGPKKSTSSSYPRVVSIDREGKGGTFRVSLRNLVGTSRIPEYALGFVFSPSPFLACMFKLVFRGFWDHYGL